METVKKYIFPVGMLLAVIAAAMIITHFTQEAVPTQAEQIDGWKHITFDQHGNSYYIDLKTIGRDESSDGNLNFHAVFRKVYSEQGRENLIKAYSDSGVDTSQMKDIDHELEFIKFRDINGYKFFVGAESTFYKADGSEIPALKMNVSVDNNGQPQAIPGKSIVENLFDYAFNRVKKD